MANGNGNGVTNGKLSPRSWHPIISIVLGSLLGSGGSLGVLYATPVGQELTRPDPYTSTDHKIYAAKTDARLDACEKHILDHPDRRGDFDARITDNKFQIGMLAITLSNVGDIVNKNSDKLDKLLERK